MHSGSKVHASVHRKSFPVESKKPFFFLPSPPAKFPPDETTKNLFGTICFCVIVESATVVSSGGSFPGGTAGSKKVSCFLPESFYGGQARTAVLGHDESPFYPLGGGVDGLTRGDPVSLSWARHCPWFFVALLHGVAKSDFIIVDLLLLCLVFETDWISLSCITKTIDTPIHGMGTRTNLVDGDRITEYSGMSKCNVCFTICRCRGWK